MGGVGATGKLTDGMFHSIHGLLLAVCLWTVLDLLEALPELRGDPIWAQLTRESRSSG